MKYRSTRGGVANVSFEEVIVSGYAQDGGLYMPQHLPTVDWMSWNCHSYKDIVYELICAFTNEEELPRADLKGIIETVYEGNNFDHPSIAPIKKLGNEVNVMELFHGPTWAFKDYSLLLVGELLAYFLQKRKKRVNLLISTSGDTGSSAIHAVKGKEYIDIYVLFPSNGRITAIQERQMTTVMDENVHVFAVDGDSDELDMALNSIYENGDFIKAYNIGSINSINWARILIQMAHWFYGYFQVIPAGCYDTVLHVAVPTGACGNITAGTICRTVGLPVKMIACTTSKNDTVGQLIQTGKMSSRTVIPTLAKAIDISRPYNVERILYLLSDGTFIPHGYDYVLPDELYSKVRDLFTTHQVDNKQILKTINAVYSDENYLICPHTAVSLSYGRSTLNRPILCISTAAWYKFPEAVTEASIQAPEHPESAIILKAKTKSKCLKRTENWSLDWSNEIMNEIKDRVHH